MDRFQEEKIRNWRSWRYVVLCVERGLSTEAGEMTTEAHAAAFRDAEREAYRWLTEMENAKCQTKRSQPK